MDILLFASSKVRNDTRFGNFVVCSDVCNENKEILPKAYTCMKATLRTSCQ